MARIDPVQRDNLSSRQQQLYDDIMRTRPRGNLSGPFSVWINIPDIAEPADRLANRFRVNPKLDKRLIELIILLMCRDASVKYAWSVHAPIALKEGLAQATVDAIRDRARPDFARDDERVVYDLVSELLATKTLGAASFAQAISALGRDGVIEAVSCVGFYGMIGLVLNVFDIPPQSDDVLK